jgi:hypothetical protein
MDGSDLRAFRTRAPGIWAFQLLVLSGMRGNEVLVEQALRKLAADESEMARSREQTESFFRFPARLEIIIETLGPPKMSETLNIESPGAGEKASLTKISYELPL